MPEYELCRVDQLIEGRGRPVNVAGRYLAVFLLKGRVHVLDNECLHLANPIDGGPVANGVVYCPWHGWAYDLATGDNITGFGNRKGLRTYQAHVEEGTVRVTLDSAFDT